MPIRDLVSWTAIIHGTLWNDEWLQAFSLFRRTRSDGLHPDSVIVATILPVCGRLEDLQLGMALQGCALRSGFESDLYVSNALIDMYCKCGNHRTARQMFCHVVYGDTASWSILIAGYSRNYLYQESIKVYLRMIDMGLKTNAFVLTSVLPALGKLKLLKQGRQMHDFVLKQGLVSDVILSIALIDIYATCVSIREAEHVFEYVSDEDIMLWNSLIVGYNLVGDFDSTFVIFRRIWEDQHTPNSITLVSLLPICTRLGAIRQGKVIHYYATKSGLGLIVSVGNSLIDMYRKCGYLEQAMKIFNQMMTKNIITYNTIISAYGTYGLGEQCLKFYEQMKAAAVNPNKVTFIALLSACSHAGLVDRGWKLYNSMLTDYDIEPDREHYSCIVDLLGRAGNVEEACNFITKIPMIPNANVLGSLLGACRIHNKWSLLSSLQNTFSS